jgi:hypothetical protein
MLCYRDKVLACAKHFVGDGGTTRGINENNTVTDWHGLLSTHMPGYYHAIIKGVGTIMVSYSSWNGKKMHANRDLVTNFLKGTLRFRVYIQFHQVLSINFLCTVIYKLLKLEQIPSNFPIYCTNFRALLSLIGRVLTGLPLLLMQTTHIQFWPGFKPVLTWLVAILILMLFSRLLYKFVNRKRVMLFRRLALQLSSQL